MRTVWNTKVRPDTGPLIKPTGRRTTATDFSVTGADRVSSLFTSAIEKSTSPVGSGVEVQSVPEQKRKTRNCSVRKAATLRGTPRSEAFTCRKGAVREG